MDTPMASASAVGERARRQGTGFSVAAGRDNARGAVTLQRPAPGSIMTGEVALSWQGIAREPTPAEAAMLAETVEHLMRNLDERDRRILEMSLRQEPVPQISAEVGCTERTVRRVLERVRKRLERQRADGA